MTDGIKKRIKILNTLWVYLYRFVISTKIVKLAPSRLSTWRKKAERTYVTIRFHVATSRVAVFRYIDTPVSTPRKLTHYPLIGSTKETPAYIGLCRSTPRASCSPVAPHVFSLFSASAFTKYYYCERACDACDAMCRMNERSRVARIRVHMCMDQVRWKEAWHILQP